jgi:hypothetical protein
VIFSPQHDTMVEQLHRHNPEHEKREGILTEGTLLSSQELP